MKLEEVILSPDTRANQPAATAVPVGTTYCVTDEGRIIERSNGTTWESYSPTPGAGSGDVLGPASAVDQEIAVFDGTTGKMVESAGATLADVMADAAGYADAGDAVVSGDLATHVADVANPHAVSKTQVGLGSVENFPVASQAEAEAGAVADKYMTPQRTAQAITALAGGGGGGAPTTAQYVALATDAGLTAERILTGTANRITVTDGGAKAPVTLSTPQDLHTAAAIQLARLGLGAAADANDPLKIVGQYFSVEFDAGSSGSSQTINWRNGNQQRTLLTNNCTFTLSNPQAGGGYVLILTQDATGNRVPTFTSSVKWPGGVVPTWSTAAGAIDVVLFRRSGAGSGIYIAAAVLGLS